MYNIDLENLYSRIDGHILLASAYIQNPVLIKIIKSCRLKPYSIFTGDFKAGTRFEKHWVDEFGNSLKFDGTEPHIVLSDPELMNKTKISTDLFFGNSVNTVSKDSKFALIAKGKYFGEELYLVAFYGQDEYFRVFIHNGKWSRISPLLLGMNTLNELHKYIGSQRITEIDKKRLDFVMHFDVDKCITTSLPLRKDMVSFFKNEIITSII